MKSKEIPMPVTTAEIKIELLVIDPQLKDRRIALLSELDRRNEANRIQTDLLRNSLKRTARHG